MAEYAFTPLQEKPSLKYADRLHEIKRAICTLDESLTPSKRIGNKSIGLSPMPGTPFQNRQLDSIALIDHQNVLSPRKMPGFDTAGRSAVEMTAQDMSLISVTDSVLQNPEIAVTVDKITSANLLIKGFSKIYRDMSAGDVLSIVSSFTMQCEDLYQNSKNMLPSVKYSKKLSLQIKNVCSDIANERYTWKLLGAIYQNKLNTSMEEGDDGIDSDMGCVNRLYVRDEEVRHYQVVLDWLESNAAELIPELPTKVGYFSGKVSWENTFHTLCNQKLKKTVSSMDPDAPTREDKPLNETDSDDQSRLINHLFYLVRAGQSDEAQKLCISSGQCWRAAVIDGWRLYNDPNYSNVHQQREAVEGNLHRALWKSCCWDYCSTANISTEERALYGSLSGNLKAMLPVCTSFSDTLWAHIKTLIDQQVENELCDSLIPQDYWNLRLSLESIVDSMRKLKQSDNLYNKLQLQLIIGDLPSLLVTVSEYMKSACVSERRFLCHLLLVLELLHPGLSPNVIYDTISMFVRSLREEECMEELLYYSSQLPDDLQISLLSDVLSDVDQEERGACVDFAVQFNIPIESVTMKIYQYLLSSHSPSNNDIVSVANISDKDAKIVSAVSWLLLTDSQRSTALQEANRLIRRFLGARKHAPACAVFEMIPADSIDVIQREWSREYPSTPLPPDDTNAVREYLCLQAYLDTHQAYSDWCSHSANRPDGPACDPDKTTTFSEQVAEEEKIKSHEIAHQRWEQNLIIQTQLTRDKMLNVLLFIDGGWLVDEVEGTDASRSEQLLSLRTQCIPATTFLLVNVLVESGQDQAVVELSEYVASEQYQLYQLFSQKELKEFLDKVYESSIRCGCDPLGYDNTQPDDIV